MSRRHARDGLLAVVDLDEAEVVTQRVVEHRAGLELGACERGAERVHDRGARGALDDPTLERDALPGVGLLVEEQPQERHVRPRHRGAGDRDSHDELHARLHRFTTGR